MKKPRSAQGNQPTNRHHSDSERLLVRPRRACHLLDCGITRLYELLNRGELESFLDGRSRKITVESIQRYIAKRLAAAQATGSSETPDTQKQRTSEEARSSAKSHIASKVAVSQPGGKVAPTSRWRSESRSRGASTVSS
jgi:hypothetical protein